MQIKTVRRETIRGEVTDVYVGDVLAAVIHPTFSGFMVFPHLSGLKVEASASFGKVLVDTQNEIIRLLGDPKTQEEQIVEWGKKTFGENEGEARQKAITEMTEFIQKATPEEAADIVIVLTRWCAIKGASLMEEVKKKMEVNLGREWHFCEEEGNYRHKPKAP